MLVAELQTPPAVGKQEGVTEAAAQVGLNVLSDNLHRRQEISSRLILAIRCPLLLNSLIFWQLWSRLTQGCEVCIRVGSSTHLPHQGI
jgi:hypothetical protein